MSIFGGKEARKRTIDLETALIEVDVRVKIQQCQDKDVLTAVREARAYLQQAWTSMEQVTRLAPFDAWSGNHIANVNNAVDRGLLGIKRATQFLDALGDSRRPPQ